MVHLLSLLLKENIINHNGQVPISFASHTPTNTSRKHGKKEPHTFSYCGSFDHPDLQSINECIFVFLVLRLQFWNYGGMPSGKSKKKMQSFNDCKSWWSKEPQWENNCGSFLPCFLLVQALILVVCVENNSNTCNLMLFPCHKPSHDILIKLFHSHVGPLFYIEWPYHGHVIHMVKWTNNQWKIVCFFLLFYLAPQFFEKIHFTLRPPNLLVIDSFQIYSISLQLDKVIALHCTWIRLVAKSTLLSLRLQSTEGRDLGASPLLFLHLQIRTLTMSVSRDHRP